MSVGRSRTNVSQVIHFPFDCGDDYNNLRLARRLRKIKSRASDRLKMLTTRWSEKIIIKMMMRLGQTKNKKKLERRSEKKRRRAGEDEEKEEEGVLNWKAVVIGYGPGLLFGLVIAHVTASYKPKWYLNIVSPDKRKEVKPVRFFASLDSRWDSYDNHVEHESDT